MKILETLKISGKDYTVKMSADTLTMDGKQLFGKCSFGKQCINIDTSLQADDGQKETLLHEILHAIASDREINFGDADEELLINQFAKGLYQLIKDNPDMFN